MSIIPSHKLADVILNGIDRFLDLIGLSRYQTIEEILYFIIILFTSIFIGWAIRKILLWSLRKIVKVHDTDFNRELLRQQTFSKCSHIIPPLVFMGLVPFAFESSAELHSLIMRATFVYTIVMFGIGLVAILRFIYSRYNDKSNTRNLPFKGILNTAIGLVWGVVVILCISVIVQKSPAALLGGLTAFAAVLMLIFKDTILGFVAGIQMSENDMVRVGDWIVVPSTQANGVVADVTLTTVKVTNFDNTTVMVPPYTLVSGSFQNWRSMSDSGVRRIACDFYVNPDSIAPATPETIQAAADTLPEVKSMIDKLQAADKTIAWNAGTSPVNGTLESNLGLFRAYLLAWLRASDMISTDHDLIIRVDETSAEGIAMQVYCFALTTQWEAYEAVKAGVMEHVMVSAPKFGLEILSGDHLTVDNPNSPSIAQSTATQSQSSQPTLPASSTDKGA